MFTDIIIFTNTFTNINTIIENSVNTFTFNPTKSHTARTSKLMIQLDFHKKKTPNMLCVSVRTPNMLTRRGRRIGPQPRSKIASGAAVWLRAWFWFQIVPPNCYKHSHVRLYTWSTQVCLLYFRVPLVLTTPFPGV